MNKIGRIINKTVRAIVWKRKRKLLKNRDFTILSNTCWPGFVYHDFGMRFDTPTINLSIPVDEFLKFIGNLDYYRTCKIEEVKSENQKYPVGRLGDITINFVHYKTFAEASSKFYERFARIHKDNLFVICVAPFGSPASLVTNFSCVPIKNKVIVTDKDYPGVDCAYHLPGHNGKNEISAYVEGQLSGKRYIDDFDIVSFLNSDNKDNKSI